MLNYPIFLDDMKDWCVICENTFRKCPAGIPFGECLWAMDVVRTRF